MKWNHRGILALAIGLGVASSAWVPAFAAPPDLGKDWVLKDTKKVREWSASPPKAGRGKWNLKAVKDRKYFVPDNQIESTKERTLDSSTLEGQALEQTNLNTVSERVDGAQRSKDRTYEVSGAKKKQRSLEGRSFNTYDVWTVTTKKETTKITPYETFDNISYDERVKKVLQNVYRVKTTRTFQDPKTKGKMSFSETTKEAPVKETAYGPWEKKKKRVKSGAGEDVAVTTEDVGLRQDRQKIGTSAAANIEDGGAGLAGAGTAFASGPNRGSAGSQFNNTAVSQKLTGNERAKATGTSAKIAKGNLDALYQAAILGTTLYDDDGLPWKLDFEGSAVVFTTGGAQFRLAQGMTEAILGGGKLIKIDSVTVNGSALALSGQFKRGPGKPSKNLKTK